MAKVVTSEGLQDFVSSGKPTETIQDAATARKLALAKKLAATDAPEQKEPTKVVELSPPGDSPKKDEPKPETKAEPEDTGLEAEDHDLADRAKKRIGKKHYEMKKAQEDAAKAREELAESERFAETLFNERESFRKRAEEAERARVEAKPKEEAPAAVRPTPGDKDKDGKLVFYNEKGEFLAIDYAERLAEWSGTQAFEKAKKEEADKRSKEESDRAAAIVRQRIEDAKKKYPEWERLVTNSDITLPQTCLQFLAKSEYGMDIAFFLATNKADAERIRSLDPLLAVAELGKLQTRFEKAANPPAAVTPPAPSPKVEPSGAPAPITPISTSGTGSIVIDPAKMDFRQLRAYHKERRKNGLER